MLAKELRIGPVEDGDHNHEAKAEHMSPTLCRGPHGSPTSANPHVTAAINIGARPRSQRFGCDPPGGTRRRPQTPRHSAPTTTPSAAPRYRVASWVPHRQGERPPMTAATPVSAATSARLIRIVCASCPCAPGRRTARTHGTPTHHPRQQQQSLTTRQLGQADQQVSRRFLHPQREHLTHRRTPGQRAPPYQPALVSGPPDGVEQHGEVPHAAANTRSAAATGGIDLPAGRSWSSAALVFGTSVTPSAPYALGHGAGRPGRVLRRTVSVGAGSANQSPSGVPRFT